MAASFLHVDAQDLNIGDLVSKRGRVTRTPDDHPTRDGYVVVVFEQAGEEQPLAILRAKAQMKVRCEED